MQPQIAVAFITSGASLLVAIVSIIMNNRILGYKVDELKKQVEKHNNLIERTAVVERDLKTAFSRIDDIRDDITRLNDHLIK
jgi:biopolymer transport protein ExbB/TolQ